MHTLELHNITVAHRRATVLDGLDMHVRSGRIYGLLGLNGAGKSTLLNTILGLTRFEGEVLIDDTPFSDAHLDLIGASVNGPAYYPQLSAQQNLLVHARLTGTEPARIPVVLAQVGLNAGRMRARSFSTGMKVRLAVAMALLTDPPILLLDEPQNGLDPQGMLDLRRLLATLADEGRTIIVSSHQLGEVSKMVDDIGVLVSGRLAYEGPLHGLADAGESLEQAFFRTVGA